MVNNTILGSFKSVIFYLRWKVNLLGVQVPDDGEADDDEDDKCDLVAGADQGRKHERVGGRPEHVTVNLKLEINFQTKLGEIFFIDTLNIQFKPCILEWILECFVIVRNCKQDSKVLTYSSFPLTKMPKCHLGFYYFKVKVI